MRKALLFLFIAAPVLATAQNGTKEITVKDIWVNYVFYPSYAPGFNWMKDDKFYSTLEENKIIQYSIADQKPVKTILDASTLGADFKVEDYAFNGDESKLLLKREVTPIYRHSSHEKCTVRDLVANKSYELHNGAPVSLATFSEDGSRIGFVADNNLYYLDFATGKETQVTLDGRKNAIINGGTDWVYEEEFAFTQAFHWSPDGKSIAYYRLDESGVKEFSMEIFGELYPKLEVFKYPKAGEVNSQVDIYIYNLTSGRSMKCDLGTETDQYVPRIRWTQDASKLGILRLNRLQNKLDLLVADAATGATTVVLSETEDTYVDEVNESKWTFLKNGKEFLWLSEKDGFNHLYLYSMSGQLVRQVTQGEWDVTTLCGVDEKAGLIYFLSTERSPLERHLCSIGLDGKKLNHLSTQPGFHDVAFSSQYSYYLDNWSTVQLPPQAALYDNKGKQVAMLEDNQELQAKIKEYKMGKFEFFEFKTSEAIILNGWMIKPPDFDASKKYPVLMFCYGGPGSQTVKNEFLGFNYFWHQLLAQKGYLVVSVDNRGTGGRGEAFKKVTYKQLGKYECMDQIEAAKWLANQSYVDGSRIGIWGWSFGGYLSSLCMVKGAEVFKAAIAVAPVTNWRFYDTIYTERYLQTPQLNPSGYDDNSPINFAANLKGNYLLVHGSADDNVHYQNSMEWVSALVNKGKPFDMMFYPNKNHGIFGGLTRFHLYTKMTDFVLENI